MDYRLHISRRFHHLWQLLLTVVLLTVARGKGHNTKQLLQTRLVVRVPMQVKRIELLRVRIGKGGSGIIRKFSNIQLPFRNIVTIIPRLEHD